MRGISENALLEVRKSLAAEGLNTDVIDALITLKVEEIQEPWMTLEEFLKSGFEGLCWVCYKNSYVCECTYIKKGNYFYLDFETTFDYEDVTHVQPIHKPESPI